MIYILANIGLDDSDNQLDEISSLGWDELVALKRKQSGELKRITEQIVELDKNRFYKTATEIKDLRNTLDRLSERLKQIRAEVEKANAELLDVSERISQSKNFLSIMEARLPSEKEEELHATILLNQKLIDNRSYKSEREKNEILSKAKEASMKIEAIKATRTIREQYAQLIQKSKIISDSIARNIEERDMTRTKIAETNDNLERLYETKRTLSAERESCIIEYDNVAQKFEGINARLDAMAMMRRKQREEYGHGLPSDALFKVKETARKKLESGAKLSFDELKLLYGEKD